MIKDSSIFAFIPFPPFLGFWIAWLTSLAQDDAFALGSPPWFYAPFHVGFSPIVERIVKIFPGDYVASRFTSLLPNNPTWILNKNERPIYQKIYPSAARPCFDTLSIRRFPLLLTKGLALSGKSHFLGIVESSYQSGRFCQ
jgi:hypothetical protein